MVIMHRSGGIAKRRDSHSERRTRGVAKQASGIEYVLERSSVSITFEIVGKSEGDEWSTPRKPAKGGNSRVEIDEVQVEKSCYEARWEENNEELECTTCGPTFHRHWA